MGLFDNLFLDKNTPMAINNGEEHNTDASPQQGGTGSGKDDGAPATDAITPVSPTPVVEEITPTSVSTPTTIAGVNQPITETSFTVTLPDTGVTQPQGTDSSVSFDIGGDFGFDIGGIPTSPSIEVSQSSGSNGIQNMTPDVPQIIIQNSAIKNNGPTLIVPSQNANEVSFIVDGIPPASMNTSTVNTGTSEAIVSPLLPDVGINIISDAQANPVPVVENKTENQMITENPALPSIDTSLNNLISTPLENPPIPEILSSNSQDMSTQPIPADTPVTSASIGNTDPLFAFGDMGASLTTPEAPAQSIPSGEVTPEAVIPNIVEPTPTLVPITSEVKDQITPSKGEEKGSAIKGPFLLDVEEDITSDDENNHPMSEVGKELARMTRSPRLQGKLIGFISGLEELSKEEEVVKNEKRKQIESYQMRITELKAEYETRIHALELEEADLKKQISLMDEERIHLTQVIDGFKKELEVV